MRSKQATARVIMAHVTGRDPGAADHFAGVEAELLARGITADRIFPGQYTPRLTSATRVVVVPNTESSLCRYLTREAKRVGAVSVLLMDGIVEWRNTFLNPRGGEAFLRPAPVDLVACAGEMDRRVLEALGNRAVATGLPRLARCHARWRDEAKPALDRRGGRTLLIATAKRPAFSDAEHDLLVTMLRRWREAAAAMDVRVVWRLGGTLDASLGVSNDVRPLMQLLGECDAACTTASTLMLETMMAGVPTAVLHPYGTPLFQSAAWTHGSERGSTSGEGVGGFTDAARHMTHVSEEGKLELLRLADHAASGTHFDTDPRALLAAMLSPTGEARERQDAAMALLHEPPGEAASRLAGVIQNEMERPRHASHAACFPREEMGSCIAEARAGVKRVVFMVRCENGVEGRSFQYCRAAARLLNERGRGGSGALEACVLAFTTGRDYWSSVAERPPNDETVRTVELDPFDDVIAMMKRVDGALEELGASIVVAADRDFNYAAAMRARDAACRAGCRRRFVSFPTDETGGDLAFARHYGSWDGVLGIDAARADWFRLFACERGVPSEVAPLPEDLMNGVAVEEFVGRLAGFFERVWSIDRPVAPLIAGLTLIESCHQFAPQPVDREAARSWLVEALEAVGFTACGGAASGQPPSMLLGSGCRPVRMIDEGDGAELARAIDGVPVASAMDMRVDDGPPMVCTSLRSVRAVVNECRAHALVRKRLDDLVHRGFRRIVVYGTGQHFFRHSGVFDEGFPIVGIIDDAAIAWPYMFGVPVAQTRDALTLAPDAVLLFSDGWERVMWHNTAFLRRAGVHVAPIYNTFSDEPECRSLPLLQSSRAS